MLVLHKYWKKFGIIYSKKRKLTIYNKSNMSKTTQKTIGKYNIIKTIGSGLLKVKLVYDPTTEKLYAAKVCKHKYKKPALEKEANILREISKLDVPNVIQCVEFIDNADSSDKYKAALVLELAPNDTLFDVIYCNKTLEEKLARTYFKKLVETVSALHAQGYVHRDLKSENILLDENFQLKLADFGFAVSFTEHDRNQMKTKLGTESYMAPELFSSKLYSGEKVDAFACGVLLFVFVFGRPPFYKATAGDVFYKHFAQKRPEKFWKIFEDRMNGGVEFDVNLKALITDLFKFKPEERLDVKDIMNYEWMKGEIYSDEELIEVMKPLKQIVDEEKKKGKF